jgi:hypothetical protein
MPTSIYIPDGPDADGARRRLAGEARALGVAVEWAGEPNARARRTEARAATRAQVVGKLVHFRSSAFRDGMAVIGVKSAGVAA